ncbi:cystathionine gamma-synthase family protein [Brevundimonas sp. 2R-24]|uniref:Cystathionine gamma-synthase family protein n=1 Tax=Peiella sedimenti TaxID=3061083 RepID=A0ABT8SKH5_9CAUL|nr:cystathionine gamma-synthase family protein [Caulobacteraceae bacterium XZ-24]
MSHDRRELGGRRLAPETLMMGFGYDPALSEGAIKPPLFQSSTFVFRSAEDGKRFFEIAYGLRKQEPDEALGLIYSRINNPNLEILEDRLAVWEDAERALVFSSGMAAISTSVLAMSRPGDTVLYTAPAYGGTEYLFDRILPRMGVQTRSIGAGCSNDQMDAAVREAHGVAAEKGGRLAVIYIETPANPTNQMVDIAAARASAEAVGGKERPVVLVDNTFLGPLWQKPLALGADLALYSLTKYVGGHSDLIAGACLGSGELVAKVGEMRTICGSMADPHTAWLLTRSLETLHLRMQAAQAGAETVTAWLAEHPKVAATLAPGDGDAAQQELFARQCQGRGSTFSLRLKGGETEAFRFLNALRLFKLAVSLGGTESLASHPSSTTHSDYSEAAKARCGIGPDLVRLSVGVENPDDLIADLEQALAAV